MRNELRGQKTQVLTLHMAFVDTDMTQGIASPNSTPDDIVARAFDALEAGADEVPTDELTQQVKLGPSAQSEMKVNQFGSREIRSTMGSISKNDI